MGFTGNRNISLFWAKSKYIYSKEIIKICIMSPTQVTQSSFDLYTG